MGLQTHTTRRTSKPARRPSSNSVGNAEDVTLDSLKDELAEAMAMLEELDTGSRSIADEEEERTNSLALLRLRAKSSAVHTSVSTAAIPPRSPEAIAGARPSSGSRTGRLRNAVRYGRVLAGEEAI